MPNLKTRLAALEAKKPKMAKPYRVVRPDETLPPDEADVKAEREVAELEAAGYNVIRIRVVGVAA